MVRFSGGVAIAFGGAAPVIYWIGHANDASPPTVLMASQHRAIHTDEEPEDYGPETNKDKAAQELGRKGSKKN